MGTKISTILFFLLLSSSFAADDEHRKLSDDSWVQVESFMKESPDKIYTGSTRILAVRTNDYGSYDPSPTLDKPSFKQIPN